MGRYLWLAAFCCAIFPPAGYGDIPAEFQVKREPVYGFAGEPRVARDGDTVTITFTTEGYSDVTVAVEDRDGRIVRHLASGVLGENAPEPFQRNTKTQKLVWDGKDDQGRYVDDVDDLTVRVSLGLRARLERTLFWSPHKRVSGHTPLIQAAEDGVYVYDGRVVDSVRVYDREGDYVRTAYPFPREHLESFDDLRWHVFPQEGNRLPRKEGFHQSTLLTSGNNAGWSEERGFGVDQHNNHHGWARGNAASTMAVRDGMVALAKLRVNLFQNDGSARTGPLDVGSAALQTDRRIRTWPHTARFIPYSAALSPDGTWLYLAGYRHRSRFYWDCLDVVMRVNLEKGGDPELFQGVKKPGGGGQGEGEFRAATSLAVDAQGRVYVADFTNDRVQIFDEEGTFLKAVATPKPALVRVHEKTGELYVFSWLVHNRHYAREHSAMTEAHQEPPVHTPALRIYGPFDDPELLTEVSLPLPEFDGRYHEWTSLMSGPVYWAEVDSWSQPVRIWLGRMNTGRLAVSGGRTEHLQDAFIGTASLWDQLQIKLYEIQDGELELTRDFGVDARRSVRRTGPDQGYRQRLYVNPHNGRLYLGEGKSFTSFLEIDPDSGRVMGTVELPFDAEDAAFAWNDTHIYLRTDPLIVRYDWRTWREVPWDYGEGRDNVGFIRGRGGRRTDVISGLPTTQERNWHQGGLWVTPAGHVVAAGYLSGERSTRTDAETAMTSGEGYFPPLYPGRLAGGKDAVVHVWDRHGQAVHEDALPGLGKLHGITLDQNGAFYALASAPRFIEGERYFNRATGTLIKGVPGKTRVISAGRGAPVRLTEDRTPDRPPDLRMGGPAWVENAEWFYGGVGFSGDNSLGSSACSCWNMRFGFDGFARSFAPETDHYSVAVLDSAGNLIMRIGRYGNVDDGVPLERNGGPPNPRPMGGDEVGLFHAQYVATHTDRRVFIADAGNACIRSVKLDYHVEVRTELK